MAKENCCEHTCENERKLNQKTEFLQDIKDLIKEHDGCIYDSIIGEAVYSQRINCALISHLEHAIRLVKRSEESG